MGNEKKNEKDNRRIVLLTLQFPFGKSENFLETEIHFLAESYDEVFILPSDSSDQLIRPVPENVTVLTPPEGLIPDYNLLSLLQNIIPISRVYSFCLLHSNNRIKYIKHFKSFLHYCHREFSYVPWISQCIEQYDLENVVFYDYWMLNKSLALSNLSEKGKISKTVSRAHGFDLYNDRHKEGVVPFKEFRVAKLDVISTISLHGYNYLLREFSKKISHKLVLHYLGVNSAANIPKDNVSRIVSCSSLLTFKQVDKIALAIKQISIPIEWVHFGDGPEKKNIEQIISTFPNNIKVSFMGSKKNEFILKYYADNYVSAFISLSASEGLPVSMMEVQSFGIPIVAPAINGIPEIVSDKTGVLLEDNYSLTDVTHVLEEIIRGSKAFDRAIIVKCFEEKFQSRINYQRFINEVLKGELKSN